MTEQDLRRTAELVRQAGALKRDNAGYGGHMHDGGGGALIAQADAFIAGLDRRLPAGWDTYARQASAQTDPEFALYQRLRRKFSD